ncbi:hypothetical protein, partial [Plasmodium yoelii yoelii]
MARITSCSSAPMTGMPTSISGTPARASARAMESFSSAVKATPAVCSPSRRVVSLMITAVAWQFDDQVGLAHHCLASQAGMRLQSPGPVQHVVLGVVRRVQRFVAFPHDDMAGGTSAGHLAGMLDPDPAVEQRIADALAVARLDDGAFRTQLGMGQHLDLRHAQTPKLSSFWPVRAALMLWSIRRPANS